MCFLNELDLLYVHFERGGDVRSVELVPAAVEAFRVSVGSTGDRGLPRRNYREREKKYKELLKSIIKCFI